VAALVGFVVAAAVAIALTWAIAGLRKTVVPEPGFAASTVAARHVTIAAGLAGFAVTGVVLIVTQRQNVAAAGETTLTTVLAMFVVAYMAYFSTSLLFANVSDEPAAGPFDLPAAQYAGSMVSLYFATFIGWLALRPLFETFALAGMAALVGWFLVAAMLVGYGLLASALFRSGYMSTRLTLAMPLLAVTVTLAYGAIAAVIPHIRSDDATLRLTMVAFFPGSFAYLAMTVLPILARQPRLVEFLASRWHLAVLGFAEAVMVLLGFMLLAVLRLA
jgi:hypothetical protein